MNRREIIALGAVAAPTLLASRARADHSHHHGHASKYAAWLETTERCIAAGEACQAHCIRLVIDGDTSIAHCLKTVTAMLGICKAAAPVANLDTPQVKELAALCVDICRDCKKACDDHADKHAECKACSEACAKVITAAEKVAKA